MPFFSVIIPVYNRAHRLPYVLESLKKQTFQDFETIIVDDASTDDSYQVAMSFELPNKIVFQNEQNCERCVTRNRGIDVARGRYICFLDSDDYHLPEHFQKLHDFIVSKDSPVAFFFTNAWDETEDGRRTERCCPDFENYNPYTYFLRYTVNPQRWALHRDILKILKFDKYITVAEDMDLSLRIVEKGFPIYQLKERPTVYVAASDSFTHGAADKAERELHCYNRIFAKKELIPHLPKSETKRLKSQCYFHLMGKAFSENQNWETIKYGIKSFLLCSRGYNGKTNKIVLVSCLYSLPLVGGLLRKKNPDVMRKKQKIHIPIPTNIDAAYKTLYEQKSSYVCPELGVKKYRNVFVSHEGLCLQHFRLLPYSSFNICTNYDKSFGWQYYKLVVEQYLVSTFGKSLKKITLDDDTHYALIHTKWANYSFWITSSLVRLLMLQNSGMDFTLLYPEEWDNVAYIQESLKAFPNLKFKRIPAGVHIQVKNLLLPEVRPFTACFNGAELQMVHDYIVERIPEEYKSRTYPERIYVTRRNAKYRKIANEQEVVAMLEKYNFSVVDFDDMSFWEQVAQMRSAKKIIAIHGAGMANIVFANPKTKILELLHEYKSPSAYRFPYWIASSLTGKEYRCTFNKLVGNKDDSIIISNDLFVDLFVLENNIKQMLEE